MMIYAFNDMRYGYGDVLTGEESVAALNGRKIDKVFSIPAIYPSPSEHLQVYRNLMHLIEDFYGHLQDGDVIVTSTIMNFADGGIRSPLGFVHSLATEMGVRIIALDENFDTDSDDVAKLFESMPLLDAIEASQKRSIAARRRTVCGPPYGPLDYPYFENLYSRYANGEINKVQFARKLGVSRPTLDKLLKEYTGSFALDMDWAIKPEDMQDYMLTEIKDKE